MGIKIGFIFWIFICNFCGGLLPLFWKKLSEKKNILSIMNAFAGGVFLAMALVHIQPEAVADYISIRKEGCPGYD